MITTTPTRHIVMSPSTLLHKWIRLECQVSCFLSFFLISLIVIIYRLYILSIPTARKGPGFGRRHWHWHERGTKDRTREGDNRVEEGWWQGLDSSPGMFFFSLIIIYLQNKLNPPSMTATTTVTPLTEWIYVASECHNDNRVARDTVPGTFFILYMFLLLYYFTIGYLQASVYGHYHYSTNSTTTIGLEIHPCLEPWVDFFILNVILFDYYSTNSCLQAFVYGHHEPQWQQGVSSPR